MKKRIYIGAGLLLYMLFVIFKYTTSNQETVKAQRPLTIVTSFYPMYIHTQALTQGMDVKVVNMASPEIGCLHDYQLTVDNMRTLQDGDILVINGLGAENFTQKAIAQNPHLQVIDASAVWEETHQHEEEEGASVHVEAHDEESSDHAHEHSHDNQHLWMSVAGSISQAEAISQALGQYDPERRAAYEANQIRYIQALQGLQSELDTLKEAVAGKHFVMVHETFAYMAEELGLESLGIIAADEQTSVTAKEVEDLVAKLAANPEAVIFTEPQYKELGIVRTIAKESGRPIYELDSLVTGSKENTHDYEYIQRMQTNIQVLKEAYGL
ncbi:MAG: metal ABC transporter solute-binding protein, Zn/Mn family [Cellulosilyticaceae bacterium]